MIKRALTNRGAGSRTAGDEGVMTQFRRVVSGGWKDSTRAAGATSVEMRSQSDSCPV